jgi:hypothetical protein
MAEIAGTTSEVALAPGTSNPTIPDIDIDDNGNYVIVWKAQDINSVTHCYLLYNSLDGSNALDVTDAGSNPHRVTMSRTGGNITLGWQSGGDYLFEAHCRNGGTIVAKRFQVSGNQVTALGDSFVVANRMYYSNYQFANVSSGANGDPVFVYLRMNNSGVGVYATGINFADATVKFGEIQVAAFGSGGIYYSYADLDCSNDGGFFVTYSSPNGLPNGIVYRQYDANGNALTGLIQLSTTVTTQAWNAVATRKNTNGGTTYGATISWTDGSNIYWVPVGAMIGAQGSIASMYPNVHSGAADGSGNFIFDYLDNPQDIGIGVQASFP